MSDVTRSMKAGLGFGLIAGLVFAVAQTLAAIVAGAPAAIPFRLAASVFLGPEALTVTPVASAILVGSVAHLYASALLGLGYGSYNSALTYTTRSSPGRQAAIGMLFGVMVWLVNFRLVGLAYFPWFLEVPQGPQVVLHAVAFGLPLGLLYGKAERRARPAGRSYSFG